MAGLFPAGVQEQSNPHWTTRRAEEGEGPIYAGICGDGALRDEGMVGWDGVGLGILDSFSNLNDSMVLLFHRPTCAEVSRQPSFTSVPISALT